MINLPAQLASSNQSLGFGCNLIPPGRGGWGDSGEEGPGSSLPASGKEVPLSCPPPPSLLFYSYLPPTSLLPCPYISPCLPPKGATSLLFLSGLLSCSVTATRTSESHSICFTDEKTLVLRERQEKGHTARLRPGMRDTDGVQPPQNEAIQGGLHLSLPPLPHPSIVREATD